VEQHCVISGYAGKFGKNKKHAIAFCVPSTFEGDLMVSSGDF
jgi:hypothetical protein